MLYGPIIQLLHASNGLGYYSVAETQTNEDNRRNRERKGGALEELEVV